MKIPKYVVAADAIILDQAAGKSRIVLIKRKNPPFQDKNALPGGFMEEDETLEQCCIREAKEETNLDVNITRLVGVYSGVNRDPRGRTVSGTYLCTPVGGVLKAADDAEEAYWFPVKKLEDLEFAFDHKLMLQDAGLL